jgi:DNA helicase-2/ATP-dependent DNA helicase PcrA
MRRLYLTHARERTLYGYTMPAEPSAFLQEVPEETLFVASLLASRRVVERDPERARPVARTAPGTAVHPAATASATPRFSPGERVIHPRWGEGIIVGISRSGVRPGYAGNVHLRIAFANQGVQTIAAEEVTRKGK